MRNRAAPREAGEAARSGAWLSRKDWRRLVALWLDGRLSRAEFERLKERLARVRTGGTAASALPRPAPAARAGDGEGAHEPRLRVVSPAPGAAPQPAPRERWDPQVALARARAAAARFLRDAG